MSLIFLADSLYESVSDGNVDAVREILKRGANVNVLPSCGRTALGRAAQLGHVAIVCLLLDADKFYATPEEDDELSKCYIPLASHENEFIARFGTKNYLKAPKHSSSQSHKCCSPSIDSETYTCSDEVWGQDASDTNVSQLSDMESNSLKKETSVKNLKIAAPAECSKSSLGVQEENSKADDVPGSAAAPSLVPYPSQYSVSNIGYYVYEYREEDEEDTEESSGPVVSSTEDSDSALFERKQSPQPPHRHSSILLHRTLGQGRSNIVSSDSEFETENYHRRRHARHHNHHKSHRHERDNHHQGRTKVLMSSAEASNPFFSQLHREYLSLGLCSPWAVRRTCDINQLDAYGISALHYATEQGHSYIVHLLIRAGVKADALDAEHMTALHLASQRGYAEIVNLLLDGGAKVNNKMNDKSSPLHIAASRGYTDIVEALLDRGAKIDSLDGSDRTPLFLAVSRAHHKVVQLLIQRGAKVNIEEIHGYTPLCEAVWLKDVRLVEALLNARAKVTQSHYLLHYAVLHRHQQLVEKLLVDGRCVVNLRDESGDTALIIAARTCQPSIIKILLKNEANVNYPNGVTGTKPLHEVVEGTRDAQFDEFEGVFRLLCSYGAKLDGESLLLGDTPLYRALLLEKNKAAALLIKHGCDVNIASTDYLKMAVNRGHFPLASLVILAGYKMNKATWIPKTATPATIMARMIKIKMNPLSLVDQCRIGIRRKFGDKIWTSVEKSNLPERIKRFLLLQDVPDADL